MLLASERAPIAVASAIVKWCLFGSVFLIAEWEMTLYTTPKKYMKRYR
jgi:hypothetical protein